MSDLTALLDRLRAGDPHAAGELFDRVYAELKRMAVGQVNGDAAISSPTELVHEAYLRLFPGPAPAFADRGYFFAAAATAMRRVRVDHARARGAAKRGGGTVFYSVSAVEKFLQSRTLPCRLAPAEAAVPPSLCMSQN